MSYAEFEALTGEMLDTVPPALLEGLNGGIMVKRGARRRRGDPPGVYLLGEYVTDPFLGCFIILYYGSFLRVFGADRAAWEEELWTTLKHEIRHHAEARAGIRDLEREDLKQLEELGRPG